MASPDVLLLNEIVSRSTDESVLAKYKSKKSPKYKISKQEFEGLEMVKVTPIGTFLVFDKAIDTAQFKMTGKFEKLARANNVIAISYEKVMAPKAISIEFEGKKLLLTKESK